MKKDEKIRKEEARSMKHEARSTKLENGQLNVCHPEIVSGSVACGTGQDKFRTKRGKTRVLEAGSYYHTSVRQLKDISPKGRITKNKGRKAHNSWLETHGFRYENSIATQRTPPYPLKGTSLKVVPDGKRKVSRISPFGVGGSIGLIYKNSTVKHSKRLGLTAHTESSVFDELTIKAC